MTEVQKKRRNDVASILSYCRDESKMMVMMIDDDRCSLSLFVFCSRR